jgi:PAS domain S-box-containing protein
MSDIGVPSAAGLPPEFVNVTGHDLGPLHEKQGDLEDFFENAAVALHIVGGDGIIQRANLAELELLGYRADEYIGRHISEFHADAEVCTTILARLAAGQRVDKFRARLRAKDGTIKDVLITSNAQMHRGRLASTRCFTIDVTDWMAAEAALRAQDRRLAVTYEQATVAIVEVDAEGRRQRVNEMACRLTGRDRADLLGRPFFDTFEPEESEREQHSFRQLVTGEVDQYVNERRIAGRDGTAAWVAIRCSAVRDEAGAFLYAIRIIDDVTERVEAEQRRRDTERQLRDLMAALPAAVYTTDASGRITYYNQAAVELSGRVPELGTDHWCVTWKLYRPDGTPLPHDECPMAIALKEGRAIRNVEAVAERPDGTRVPFIPFPTPLRNAAGELVGAVNMLIDISERKQAETQQRVLLDELNHRVKNNMQMLHSLLWGAQRETQNPEARAVLADAGRRVAAMAAAQQTLYDARAPMMFDAQQFIESVCDSAQQGFPSGVRIVREHASGHLSNDAAMPLALILNELLTNAVKHGVNGREQGTVRVGLTQSSSTCELYVEDDGPGFDLPDIRRRSSGIGLVIGLARQLGGTLDVQRSPCRCTVRFQTIES